MRIWRELAKEILLLVTVVGTVGCIHSYILGGTDYIIEDLRGFLYGMVGYASIRVLVTVYTIVRDRKKEQEVTKGDAPE